MSRQLAGLVLLVLAVAACSSGAESSQQASVSVASIDEGSSVELVPTGADLRAGCRRAADLLGFRVPCPTRLPRASVPTRCEVPPAFRDSEADPKEGCALGEGFLLEPSGIGHLVIQGERGAFQADCGGRGPDPRVTVQGHEAFLIDCPDTAGLHGGHVLLRWAEEGTFVIVSLHGHTELNRRLVQEIGAGIELVGPDEADLVGTASVEGGAAAGDSRSGWRCLARSPLTARSGHSAVWTGAEMIVLGGSPAHRASVMDGAAYEPRTDTWRTIADAPLLDRERHTAVWTGKEMIVWGGDREGGLVALDDGAAYDPAADTWRPIADSPLEGRFGHTAVWTGREMIVFGGFAGSEFGDAAAYHPAADKWRRLRGWKARWDHSATWTGREMIVWGGDGSQEYEDDGGAYHPASNRWRELPDSPLEGRILHSAVWTGSEMLIVGGASNLSLSAVAAAYAPARERWRRLPPPPVGFPSGHEAVWTGRELILWGGRTRGAAYNPERDVWRLLPRPRLERRIEHTTLWTGREVIVWGGEACNDGCYQSAGAAYVPPAP